MLSTLRVKRDICYLYLENYKEYLTLKLGIIAWGDAYKNKLKPLKMLQKHILKIIYNVKHYSFIKDKIKELNLLNFAQKYGLETLLNNYDDIKKIYTESQKNSRGNSVPPMLCKKSIGQKSSYYMAIIIFNTLPEIIKDLGFSKKRAKIIKKCFLLLYVY